MLEMADTCSAPLLTPYLGGPPLLTSSLALFLLSENLLLTDSAAVLIGALLSTSSLISSMILYSPTTSILTLSLKLRSWIILSSIWIVHMISEHETDTIIPKSKDVQFISTANIYK